MTVRDYSTTANDNTTIEGIALADTMLANALDNAIRQAMADTGNFLLDIAKPTSTTGSANAYSLTTGGTVGAYADKVRLAIRPNFSNTGACTINVDAVGVVDLKIYTSAGVGDPTSGQIQSGGVYDILYVDALGDFVVLNPTPTAHASGDMLAENDLSDVADAPTAFNNIKQAATTSATGVSELSTDAEGDTGTSTSLVTPVSTVKSMIDKHVPDLFSASGSAGMFACRAWVNFNGTGVVAIQDSGNVSSITDDGTGQYTVNIATALTAATYATSVSSEQYATRLATAGKTTSAFSFTTTNASDSNADSAINCCSVFE